MSYDEPRQPQDVSEVVTNYLQMTSAVVRPRPDDHQRRWRERRPGALIDNEGLPLEEGNDFA